MEKKVCNYTKTYDKLLNSEFQKVPKSDHMSTTKKTVCIILTKRTDLLYRNSYNGTHKLCSSR